MGWKDSDNARQSAKMRVCLWPSLAVLALVQDGIEKVRGSTPLISTIIEMRFAHMKQGLNAFFVLTDSSFIPWEILEALAKPL